MLILDLEAHRCPTAMIHARRTLTDFANGLITDKDNTIAIQTIEPSFARDLPVFLNSVAPNIKIINQLGGEISTQSIEGWVAHFDKEDWEGCRQECFILKMTP